MPTATISDGTETVPALTALKNLAKLHNLPPFDRIYSSGRHTLVAVDCLVSDQWRAALALPPFDADGETEGFWMGSQIKLVKL